MKVGDQIQSKNEIGTIVRFEGENNEYAIVDYNGVKKKHLSKYMRAPKAKKVKSYMKEESAPVTTKQSIFAGIVGSRESRGSMFNFSGDYTAIMKKADEQGNFVGSIIMDAIDGKLISDKQAWAVAFFAQKNGFCK